MCPHMAGLLARYKRSPYGRRGRHDGFLSFALAVSAAASLGHIGAGGALAAGVRVYVRLKPEAPDRARADALHMAVWARRRFGASGAMDPCWRNALAGML